MKNLIYSSFLFVTILFFSSCNTEKPWQPVFNGENLDNWEIFIGTPLRGFDSLAQIATPESVFSIVEENGEKYIRISGDVNASLATIDTFANYHMQLIFKWGDEVFTSRNSGFIYHSSGEFGKGIGTWMSGIECQLMNERMGDTYLMYNTYSKTAVKEDGNGGFVYAKDGEIKEFGKDYSGSGINRAVDAFNPVGEWNTVELYSVGQTTVHVVNGQVTMVNTNTGKVEDGVIIPISSGKIQIQSEGGELFIKTLQVKPLKEIPAELLQ
jgi:hypothetical protein